MAKRTAPPAEPQPAESPEQPPSEVAAAVVAVLREPRIEQWIDLEGLPGWQVRAWLNHPWRLRQDLISGDNARFRAAFRQVVLSHNDWHDGAGEPYPRVEDDPIAFWVALSPALARTMLRSIYEVSNALGNFPTPPPASTDSG